MKGDHETDLCNDIEEVGTSAQLNTRHCMNWLGFDDRVYCCKLKLETQAVTVIRRILIETEHIRG